MRPTNSGESPWWASSFIARLSDDAVRLWRSQVRRLREDHHHRNLVLTAVLQGLINALTRGPRATVLWPVVLVLEVTVAFLQALAGADDDDRWTDT